MCFSCVTSFCKGRVLLGCGGSYGQRQPDVTVQGTGVEPIHCYIENIDGVVSLYPIGEMTSVDGMPVATPVRLTQGMYIYKALYRKEDTNKRIDKIERKRKRDSKHMKFC